MIVMGGEISHGYDLLRKPIEGTIQERAMPGLSRCAGRAGTTRRGMPA